MTMVRSLSAGRIWTLAIAFAFALVLLVSGGTALAQDGTNDEPTTDPSFHSAIIDNGVIQLGVLDQAHLGVGGGARSLGRGTPGVPSTYNGTTAVGLRYLPTGAESTAPGCICEGWGVADAGAPGPLNHGEADVSVGGVTNLSVVSFTSTASTAVSVVDAFGRLRVTHDFHPSPATANLYETIVTIENISSTAVSDLRYTRTMDWDIEPTPFSEYSTVQGVATSANLLYADDNGFQNPNPLLSRSPQVSGAVGDFVDVGPADHGAHFDFGFDPLAAGASMSFKIYYGAAGNETDALAALGAVGAEAYSFGQTNTGNVTGEPNTFIFAFSGVGGVVLVETPLNLAVDGSVTYTEDDSPVLVAPDLTITGTVDDPIDGATVTIGSGFVSAEDTLGISGSLPAGLSASYNAATGVLTISGSGSTADYQDALRQVTYVNSSQNPDPTPRSVTISLGTALAFPDNGHFYEFVSSGGIQWTAASTAAQTSSLYGLQGYLATITSAAENAFIKDKLQGNGWLGSNDVAIEGDWRWVDGPEAGNLFTYTNWNSGEPNNCCGGEDYLHMIGNAGAGPLGTWNDLPLGGGGGAYYVLGYVVEYGGLTGDPDLTLSGNVTVNVVPVNDPPTADAGGPYTVDEGSSITLSGSGADIPAEGTAVSFAWDLDNDGSSFETPGQNVAFLAVDGPATPTVGLQVCDSGTPLPSACTTTTVDITVNNVAPTVHADAVTVTFGTGAGEIWPFPSTYTENGVTVTAIGFPGHMRVADVGGGNRALYMNSSNNTSSTYRFDMGGAAFTLQSVDTTPLIASRYGTHTLTSSAAATQALVTGTTIVLPAAGWTDITYFEWTIVCTDSPCPNEGYVDNVVIVPSDLSDVTVDEGDTANNTGGFSDPGDDIVTVSASIGSVSQVGTQSGTWAWEFDATDGPVQSGTVTITATDSDGAQGQATFELTVNNVDPVVEAGDDIDVDEGTEFGLGDSGSNVLYSEDFQGAIGSEWSTSITYTAPTTGSTALGNFGNGSRTLTLTGLGAHTEITLDFELHLNNSWDGNGIPICCGIDIVDVSVAGGPTLLHSTFSNTGQYQTYPSFYPGPNNPSGTGATIGGGNSMYALSYTFPHTGSTFSVDFTGIGLQGLGDESWGLDNVTVSSDAATGVAFTDVGVLDTHTASINWGDGNVEAGTVTESGGAGVVNGTHAYGHAGTYTVTVTVTDDDGGIGSDTFVAHVANVAPTITSISASPSSFDEGQSTVVTALFTDPSWLDTHTATVDCGGGDLDASSLTEERVRPDSTGDVAAVCTFGHAGTYTVTVTVTDDLGDSDTATVDVTVVNVAPTLSAITASAVSITEGQSVSVEATFTDPSWLDTHTATVDCGDASLTADSLALVEENVRPDSAGTINSQCTYGDNGIFTITMTVTDDLGDSDTQTVDILVSNVDPTLTLDHTGSIEFAGGEAFIGRNGVEQSHDASATDPGSDDLTFDWSFSPDATTQSTTYLNGTGPDAQPSPDGTYPTSASDTGSVNFSAAGIYTVDVTVTDDDGGSDNDSLAKLVVDNRDCTRSQGFWSHQFRPNGKHHVDDATLLVYLAMIEFASPAFSEVADISTLAAAADIMTYGGPDKRAKATKQALAAWLNWASGAIGWTELIDTDGDNVADTPFNAVIAAVDAVILDGGASNGDLNGAKDLAEAVNLHDKGNPDCSEEESSGDEESGGDAEDDDEPADAPEGDKGNNAGGNGKSQGKGKK